MIQQDAERFAGIAARRPAAAGTPPLEGADERLQDRPVLARPRDLERRPQDGWRTVPVGAPLQELLERGPRRRIAPVGEGVQDEGPAVLVEVAAIERGPGPLERLRRPQADQRLQRPGRRNPLQRAQRPHQQRDMPRPAVPSKVHGDQLGGHIMLVEQVRAEEIGRLLRMLPGQTVGRPGTHLGVLVAQEALQVFEGPEPLGHDSSPPSTLKDYSRSTRRRPAADP